MKLEKDRLIAKVDSLQISLNSLSEENNQKNSKSQFNDQKKDTSKMLSNHSTQGPI